MCMYIMVVIIGIAFTIRDQVLFSWACDISDVIYVGIIDCTAKLYCAGIILSIPNNAANLSINYYMYRRSGNIRIQIFSCN